MKSTALTLLEESLKGDLPDELRDRITSYLGNRHMSEERIVLGVRNIQNSGDPKTLPGFTVVETPWSFVSERTGETRSGTHEDVTYPEAGTPRLYDGWGSGIIVPICGRLWRVSYFDTPAQGGYDDFPTADGKQIVFEAIPEGTPETEFTAWDPIKALRDYNQGKLDHAEKGLRKMVEAVARFHAGTQPFESDEAYDTACDDAYEAYVAAGRDGSYVAPPFCVTQKGVDEFEGRTDDEYAITRERLTAMVEKARKGLDDADGRMNPPKFLCLFGQPNFLQNEFYPEFQGRPGMALATMDTGWGDSGNENLLFAVDDDGYPVAAWFEASCH